MAVPVYHAGFECPVLLGTVDYHAKSWNFEETTNEIETTNTGDYNATDNRTYGSYIKGVTRGEGSITIGYDSNNDAVPAIQDGAIVAAVFTKSTGHTISCNVYIRKVGYNVGGMEEETTISIDFRSTGKVTHT